MKLRSTSLLILFCWCLLAQAQLQILPYKNSQSVFAGDARNVSVVVRNSGTETVEVRLGIQLYQASTATAVTLGKPIDWKRIRVLPDQTVLESAAVNFPAVNGETKFIVQWQADSNRILGATEVMVYPADLLAKLKTLAGDGGLGVLDPQNHLKPLLKNLNVEFSDLENRGLEYFSGRLVIVESFPLSLPMHGRLAGQVKELAKKGAGVVWIQALPERADKPLPSFYSIIEKTNAVVIVQQAAIAGLTENPRAQLNLVYFCQLALHPELASPQIYAPTVNRL